MRLSWLSSHTFLRRLRPQAWQQWLCRGLAIAALLIGLMAVQPSPAYASLNDDGFDGNIFALYAGNGSLVPPRVTLADSLKRQRPAILFFYLDDSRDSKQYASVVSQLQAFYGRAADFLPISIDTLPLEGSPDLKDPAHYYKGFVPQTVIIDQAGKVAFDQSGVLAFESVDDALRKVFDLLPRSESVELKRRPLNEINIEITAEPK